MKITGTRGFNRTLTAQQRADRAKEWRTWRKRDSDIARWAFHFLRDFQRDVISGGVERAMSRRVPQRGEESSPRHP